MIEGESFSAQEAGRLTSAELKEQLLLNLSLAEDDGSSIDEARLDYLIAMGFYSGTRLPNGTIIIFVNEPDEKRDERNQPNPLSRALATSPLTTAVALEYSYQDLCRSISRSHVARGFQQRAIDYTWETNSKVLYFRIIEQLCEANGKQIMAIDIANKALFQVYEGAAIASIFGMFVVFYAFGPIAFALTPLQLQGLETFIGQFGGTSIYDPDQIHRYERFVIEIEDARRAFAARNLWRAQDIFRPAATLPDGRQMPSQIIAYAQRAHGMRWQRNIELMIERYKNGIPGDQKDLSELGVRFFLYPLLYPGLDFDARYYPPLHDEEE